jgi:hypothetical protein
LWAVVGACAIVTTLLGGAPVVAQAPAEPATNVAPTATAPVNGARTNEAVRILVGLPKERTGRDGQLSLTPNVNVLNGPQTSPTVQRPAVRRTGFNDPAGAIPGVPEGIPLPGAVPLPSVPMPALQLPSEALPAEPLPSELLPTNPGPGSDFPPPANLTTPSSSTPIFADLLQPSSPQRGAGWRSWWNGRNIEPGVGRDRLANAPFVIDTAQPMGNLRLRMNSYNSTPYPDRAEYLWAKRGGRGPQRAEQNIDYQEARAQLELGGEKFSAATEFPLRWTNPAVNPNHTGFSDMNITVKTVFVDGKTWQITQLFRTYVPTGSASMGLGTGHVSLEPGVLARYKWSDVTFLHGQLKYFFPIGGDPSFQGQVLGYGIGMSHVLIDRDNYAVIPTMELVGSYIGNGLRTNPNGTVRDAAGEHIFNMMMGVRFVQDCGGDLGLFEWGINGGIPASGPRFYDGFLQAELRFSF